MSRKRAGAGTAKAEEASAAMTSASAVVNAGPERRARTPTGGRPGFDDSRVTEERQAACAGGDCSVTYSPVVSSRAHGAGGARKMLLGKHGRVQSASVPPIGEEGPNRFPQFLGRERLAQDRHTTRQLGLHLRCGTPDVGQVEDRE